ncbi:MAG: flippase [Candidatus ainarchaeum sp.]|nr:flippase [Candidatus ainarchaeum sp.]
MLPKKIISKITGRPMVQKIIKNIGWLSIDRIIQLFISFTVILWMIRYLGPNNWGILNYVWAFTGLFSVFIPLGLNQILFKNLVENPEKKNVLIGTVFYLQFLSSIFFIILTILFAFLFIEDLLLFLFIVIFSFSNIFYAFQTISTYFDSKVESKYSAISREVALVIAALIKIYFILFNFSIIYFIFVSLIEQFFLVLSLIYFYSKTKNNLFKFNFNFLIAKNLLKSSWPLILSGVAMMIYLRIDQLFVGTMLSMYDLGVYSVVVKLAEFGNVLPGILIASFVPSIIINKLNFTLYTTRLTKLYSLVIFLAIGLFIFLFVFADLIILFLYGVQYLAAVPILRIYSIAIIPFFISVVLAQYFVIENLTKYSFYTTVIGAVTNIVLNLILIPIYGLYGAAIATVISYSLLVISIIFFKKTRGHLLIILNAFNFFKYLKF